MKSKKTKSILRTVALLLPLFLISVGCGFMIGLTVGDIIDQSGGMSPQAILAFVLLFFLLYLGIFLQIIIHEAGHLVFGLASGYGFSSFRIMSFMLVKADGKLKFKRLSIAGTGGQCLMTPPQPKADGRIPYIAYNLGGVIFNIASAAVALPLFFLFGMRSILGCASLIFAVVGIFLAAMNGIPMNSGTIDNDGKNALSLGKDEAALRSFFLQMKVNDEISRGTRLRDMPEDWFALPSEEEMKNPMTAAVGVFVCNRLVDEHRFDDADALAQRLLAPNMGTVGLHRNLLICDRIFIELIGQCRSDMIERLKTKEYDAFARSMRTFPSIIRTEYAYARLYKNDEKSSEKLLADFEKCAGSYPYPNEINAERELIALVMPKQS